ncbi:MAG: SusD/RagB family nutrient-binding outer membrane lipoprotein [Saprospiraceae bacterium]|nr:SusD/RagB family nutrient-binding outer membrane lipoprotein [Saprospiraceae bacterium]MBK9678738.1 SusD/RagB family nutrient-binding outer membrane lipoprotein [Saprospiraceae bacterium]
MKNILFKLLMPAFILLMASCTESFLDVNTNPNNLPSATPSYVFTNALNTTAENMVGSNVVGNGVNQIGHFWSGQWTQSSSYILTTTLFSYQFTNGDFTGYWDRLYNNLNDYQYVINNAEANDQKYFSGPAKVMKAYIFQALVDIYGNIPYSDALKGVDALAPKFDDQKAVYENLIILLDEAIVDLKANAFASAFSGSDIVFKGNTTKWVKFANSLKLRILIHQSRVSGREGYITTELNKINSEGSGFIVGEEVASGGAGFFVATAGKQNPIYDYIGYDANGAVRALARYNRPTKFLFDVLIAANDTFRLKRIAYAKGGESAATPGKSAAAEVIANYVGVPFGIASGFTAQTSSYIGPSLIVKGEYNRPVVLMTAAEIQFALAEAKQRFTGVSIAGTAQSFYEEGVKQSFRLLGAPNAAVTTLLSSGIENADWSASSDKIKAINHQKWIAAVNFEGLEAWTEYRKNNYPNIPQAATVTNNNRPLRLFYPSTEEGSNTNVASQGVIDVFATKIFWDVD